MDPRVLARHELFLSNERRLQQLAWRAINVKGLALNEFVVVCVDVDDASWTELVDALMPGYDWDSIRRAKEKPVARGYQPWFLTELFAIACPDLAPAFLAGPPGDQALAVVCCAGGASVYPVMPIVDERN